MKAATIRDVAHRAGVSFSTASLALRVPSRVTPKTRKSVLRAARVLGYQKNVFASILSRGRQQNRSSKPLLGFLTWQRPEGDHQFWVEANHWAKRLNYTLLRLDLEGERNPQRVLDVFYAQGGSGLFVGPVHGSRQLDLSRFAAVQMTRLSTRFAPSAVEHAIFDETTLAFQRMRARGYRAILPAIRRHEPVLDDDRIRRGAILSCRQELRADERAIPPLESSHREQDALVEAVRRYRPDAVLGFTYWDAVILRDRGIRDSGRDRLRDAPPSRRPGGGRNHTR